MLNVLSLLSLTIGVWGLTQAPIEVRSLVMPWPVLRGLLVLAGVANIGSIFVLAARAARSGGEGAP
jgi:hypothetical protein